MADLTREEFLTHIGYVRQDVQEVQDRLDVLNGRTRINEQAVAVLQDRSNSVTTTSATAGGAVGAAVAGAVGTLLHWLGIWR